MDPERNSMGSKHWTIESKAQGTTERTWNEFREESSKIIQKQISREDRTDIIKNGAAIFKPCDISVLLLLKVSWHSWNMSAVDMTSGGERAFFCQIPELC